MCAFLTKSPGGSGRTFPDSTKTARCSGILLAPLLVTLLCPAASAQQQVKAQWGCIVRMNKDGAGVAAADGKLSASCIQDVTSGEANDLATCFAADTRLVPRARDRTDRDEDKNCATERPDFGVPPTGDISDTVNDAAVVQKEALLQEVFGLDPTAALVASRDKPDVPGCQVGITKSYEKLLKAAFKQFNKCKKAALRGGEIPPIATSAELEGCLAGRPDSVDADPGEKIASKLDGVRDAQAKHCAGVDLGSAFPGSCAAATSLPDCLGQRVMCRTCAMVNAMDGLASDCDRFDDGHANQSCIESCDSGICDDSDVCTDDACDLAAGCSYQNNTAPCSDADACTAPDSCVDGICVPGAWVCPRIALLPDPLSIYPGDTREWTVTISEPAAAGGVSIALANSNPTAATLPASLSIPEGQSSGVVTVTGGSIGSSTVTASAPGHLGAAATVQVELAWIRLRLIDTPNVAVGRDATLEVELVQPRPGSPVEVALWADDPGLLTVPPSVLFSAGQATARTTVHGLAVGATVLRASAPGSHAGELDLHGELPVEITSRYISLALGETLTPREDLLVPVNLSTANPAGVTVTLESADTAVMTVNTPTVFFGPGQISALASLHGVAAGTTELKATAPDYATDFAAVTVSAELRSSPMPFYVLSGVAVPLTITYYHDDGQGTVLPHVAPSGGIHLSLAVDNADCITVDSTEKWILEGQISTTVMVTGIPAAQCPATITVTSAETGSTDFAVFPAGPLQFVAAWWEGSRIGTGLQVSRVNGIPLGAPAPAGGVTVHIESQDPSQVLVSASGTEAGSAAIDLFVPEGGARTDQYFIAAAPGAPLNVGTTLQATASGYQAATSETLQVVPTAYFTENLPGLVHGGVTTWFRVCVAAYQEGTTFQQQSVAGGNTIPLTVHSSDTSVGTVGLGSGGVFGGSVGVEIPAGESCTSWSSEVGVHFRAVAPGTTTVSSSGLPPCESLIGGAICYLGYWSHYGAVEVTVDVPPLTFGPIDSSKIGTGLQTSSYDYGIELGAPAPAGGVTVHLASQDPSQVLVSTSGTEAGSAAIDLFVPEGGTRTERYFIAAAPGAPLNVGTTLRATAAGYLPAISETFQVVPSAYFTNNLPGLVHGGVTTDFLVCVAAFQEGTTFQIQSVAGGSTIPLTIHSSDPSVGTVGLGTGGVFGGSVDVAIPAGESCTPWSSESSAYFRAVAPGTTTVSSSGLPPCESLIGGAICYLGYWSYFGVVDVTVDVPPLTFGPVTGLKIGAGLQTSSYYDYGIELGSPAPAGGVTVHLASQDSSQVLVSTSGTEAGSAAIDLFVPEGGTRTARFFIAAATGAPLNVGTTLQATAAGYLPAMSDSFQVVPTAYFTNYLPGLVYGGVTTDFVVCLAAFQEGTTFQIQSVAGGSAIPLTIHSSDPSVGTVGKEGAFGGSVEVTIPAGENCTPWSGWPGTLQFHALTTGTTTVSSSGLPSCESLIGGAICYLGYSSHYGDVEVTVDVPPLTIGPISSSKIGAGLQTGSYSYDYGIELGAPAPAGGVTVHLASQDPSQVLVAASDTEAGSAAIDVFVPEGGTRTGRFFIAAAPGAPLNVGTTLQATAPGYQTATSGTLEIVPAVYFLYGLPDLVDAGATVGFNVCTAAFLGGASFAGQAVAGGNTIPFTVHSSDPSVGTVGKEGVSGGSVEVAIPAGENCTPWPGWPDTLQFHALATGTTTVSSTGLPTCESFAGGAGCRSIVNVSVP